MSSQRGFRPLKNAWEDEKGAPQVENGSAENARGTGSVSQRKKKTKANWEPEALRILSFALSEAFYMVKR